MTKRTAFLLVSTLTFFLQMNATEQKPNVIFILADDMGWGDLSCYGHGELKTPNLDQLAKEGKLFTQFYVSSGVCSPSRVAFTTGQFPARHGVHGHFDNPQSNRERAMPDHLDPQVQTVGKLLKEVGYATAHFGKWHMGEIPCENIPAPKEYGFDESRGYLSSGPQLLADQKADPYYRAKTTAAIVDRTLEFVKKNKYQPFYVNAWTLIPHTILNPTPEQMESYTEYAPNIPNKTHAGAKVVYYSTIDNLDKEIGRLLDGLEELGVSENTIVIFSSDNGPEHLEVNNASHSAMGSPGPFRGRKRSLYEGGIRVPFIVRWPAAIEPGVIDDYSVLSATDLLPTLCKLAGVEIPSGKHAPDGEDVSDILMSEPRERNAPLMWEYHYEMEAGSFLHRNPYMAMRKGDWKFLMNADKSRIELYNLKSDVMEVDNLAKDFPCVVDEMSEELLEWHHSMPRAPIADNAGSNAYPWPGTSTCE
jgi:arylsulfatase A-like enzyme